LTGFDAGEIDAIIADMEEGKLDPADTPLELPETPVSCRGDLWILGKHRLLCGDARSTTDVQRLMGGETAAAVITDPPFNRAMRDIGGRGKVKHSDFACASGEMSTSEFNEFNRTTLGNAVQVAAHGAIHYVFTDWRHVRELLEVTDDLYSEMLNLCVWNKTNAGQGSFYRSQHELVIVSRVGDEHHQNNIELGRFGRNRSNVWTYQGMNSCGTGRLDALHQHPTVKPIAMIADALRDSTSRNKAALDIFSGSERSF
jgi:DNA modification methylase